MYLGRVPLSLLESVNLTFCSFLMLHVHSGTQYAAAAATSKASSYFMLVSAMSLARTHLFALDSAQSAVLVLACPGCTNRCQDPDLWLCAVHNKRVSACNVAKILTSMKKLDAGTKTADCALPKTYRWVCASNVADARTCRLDKDWNVRTTNLQYHNIENKHNDDHSTIWNKNKLVIVTVNITDNTFWLASELEHLLQVTLVRDIFCWNLPAVLL